MIYDEIEAFIEIKSSWGFNEAQITGDQVKKDIEFIGTDPERGYFVYFIGNKFEDLHDKQKQFYLQSINNFINKYKLKKENIFILFRDKIFNSQF